MFDFELYIFFHLSTFPHFIIGVDDFFKSQAQKQLKKQAKKERFQQIERERKRLTEVLALQNVLDNLGDETVREQFSSGAESAIKLEQAELDLLDELYKLVHPERDDNTRSACSNICFLYVLSF